MSTPSETIRTHTAIRCRPRSNSEIRLLARGSSLRITTGFSPVIFLTRSAYARAASWSEASSSPAASGIPVSRRWLIRSSMAADDVRDPGAGRVQGGAPGRVLQGAGGALAEVGREHLAGRVHPPAGPGVRGEDHRSDDSVGQGLAVAVGVVGLADHLAGSGRAVGHERDPLVRVRAERRPGQAEPAAGRVEGLVDGVAPRVRVPGVVDLVQDDQGPLSLGPDPVQQRPRRHLRVRGDVAVRAVPDPAAPVGHVRVEEQAHPYRRVGPLGPQVVGRRDHDDPVDHPGGPQPGGQGEPEGRLAGAGRGGHQEVVGCFGLVLLDGLGLPGAQGQCGDCQRGHQVLGRRLGGATESLNPGGPPAHSTPPPSA